MSIHCPVVFPSISRMNVSYHPEYKSSPLHPKTGIRNPSIGVLPPVDLKVSWLLVGTRGAWLVTDTPHWDTLAILMYIAASILLKRPNAPSQDIVDARDKLSYNSEAYTILWVGLLKTMTDSEYFTFFGVLQ